MNRKTIALIMVFIILVMLLVNVGNIKDYILHTETVQLFLKTKNFIEELYHLFSSPVVYNY